MNKNNQTNFFRILNEWLDDRTNQKKFSQSESDTNPDSIENCILIIGGWAIYKYNETRRTNDIDILIDSDEKLTMILDSLMKKSLIKLISKPDSTTTHTQKHTIVIQNFNQSSFSLESRFFENNSIFLGDCQISKKWLFDDSHIFSERTFGDLKYLRVPSKHKLIVLKVLSVVSREENETKKIIKDFEDIQRIGLVLENGIKEIEIITSLLNGIKFIKADIFIKRLSKNLQEINDAIEVDLNDNTIIYAIKNYCESINIYNNNLLQVNKDKLLPINIDNSGYLEQLRNFTGFVDFVNELKNSKYHPKEIMKEIHNSFDFLGHGASKWTNEFDVLNKAITKIKIINGNARFLIFDPRNAIGLEDNGIQSNEIEEQIKILKSLLVLYKLSKIHNRDDFKVQIKVYSELPTFRLAFFNGEFVLVGHYNGHTKNSNESPIMVFNSKEDWSFYSAFKTLFDQKWSKSIALEDIWEDLKLIFQQRNIEIL